MFLLVGFFHLYNNMKICILYQNIYFILLFVKGIKSNQNVFYIIITHYVNDIFYLLFERLIYEFQRK